MDGFLRLFSNAGSKMKPFGLAVLPTMLLAACGGGGGHDEPSPPITPSPQNVVVIAAPLTGYWEGTITDQHSVQRSARLIATDTGEIELYMSPIASLAVNGIATSFSTDWLVAYADNCCTNIARPATVLRMDGLTNPGAITGSTFNNATLEGDLTVAAGRYSFKLTQRSSATPLTSDTLAGTYTGSTALQTATARYWTLTIETNGRITGADDFGCQWSGSAAVSSMNVFKLALTAAGCSADPLAPKNGRYTALGRLVEAQAAHPTYPGQVTIEFATFGLAWLGYRTLAK
jgi:hypothetical protein